MICYIKEQFDFDYTFEHQLWLYSHRLKVDKEYYNMIKKDKNLKDIIDNGMWEYYVFEKYKNYDKCKKNELKKLLEILKEEKSNDVEFFKLFGGGGISGAFCYMINCMDKEMMPLITSILIIAFMIILLSLKIIEIINENGMKKFFLEEYIKLI